MTIKICLLVTDDPDDHQVIAEALTDISDNTVLLNILDSQKALLLLKQQQYTPHYVFLDLSMQGIKINSILKEIRRDDETLKIPTMVYGSIETFLQIENSDGVIFFDKEYEYPQLREFLKRVFID
jgi:CheY-like chemotaxis protein